MLVTLFLSQVNHRRVEQMLWDLTDSKNKLAYEKGKLQVCETHGFIAHIWHSVTQ